jgi:hypothetical protein
MVLAFIPMSDKVQLVPQKRYLPFVSTSPPDVVFRIHAGPAPHLHLGAPLFDSGALWALYRAAGKLVVRICRPGFDPHQIVILDPNLQRGEIYCVGEMWSQKVGSLSPLGYPLAEVLTVNLLAQGRGVLLHASAVHDGDRGFLFLGSSGAGKSTLASLWEGREDVTILSDDRVIVREHGGRFWAFGTPWHGTARLASPEAMPLDQVFVIHHDNENRLTPLKPLDSSPLLLVRSFPPFWDAEGMAFTVGLLGELARRVPCYELGFVPDDRVVDFVRCLR